jgi:hypothetical protein
MGGGKMNNELSKFVKNKYPLSKADLFSCFIERSLLFIPKYGLNGLVTMESWMFLSSFEALRKKLIENTCIQSLTHFGWHIMRIAFGTVTFILEKRRPDDKFRGTYSYMEIDNINKETEQPIHFPVKDNGRFKIANQKDFEKIPGSPIGYWVSEKAIEAYTNNKQLSEKYSFKRGIGTGNNDRFLRYWCEIEVDCIKYKWQPYNKGGDFKKWYGNRDYVINWDNNGFEIKNYKDNSGKLRSRPQNLDFNFVKNISYSSLTSGNPSFRIYEGFLNDQAGNYIVPIQKSDVYVLMYLLNSKIGRYFITIKNQTFNITSEEINTIPIKEIDIFENNYLCVEISKTDWDSHETSWDFKTSPLIVSTINEHGNNSQQFNIQTHISSLKDNLLLQQVYDNYKSKWSEMFFQLHHNEEELNRQFIEIYGLQDELTPDVPLEEITILQEETSIENGELVFHADEVFAQFVSYAVGCMFGRYSLDKEGLILANQGETLQDYLEKVGRGEEELTFVPDRDNIIPVLDDEWFRDDIVERFHTFLKASFGEQNFRKNLDFVEECLGKDIRKYFTRDFYKDHIRRYKKRPIYWMFSSPKGYFNVLVYLHRYTPDTINRILNSYLKEFIEKLKMYRSQQEHIEVEGSVTEQNKARKEIDRINVMLEDCMQYEMEILYPLATERIALDLDDGVLVNYNKLGSAVAKVAGLNDKKTKEKVRGFDWIDTSQIRD